MIRFSQRLQDVLASTGWPQKELARRAAVSATNVSRWLGGKALPDRPALGRVIDVLPENLVPPLIAAWVYDSLPPNAERMVGIVAKNPSSKVRETPPDEWPDGLNRASRRKFIDFARVAMDYDDVMKIVDVLHGAAMRMSGKKGTVE
ncbi:MAG: helix-turn-helix transcriptional regulator [Luteolibacter sp.]